VSLGDQLARLSGSSGPDGVLSGTAPEATLVADLPFQFDATQPAPFAFGGLCAVRSITAADATTSSLASVDFTISWGGLQFFDPAGAALHPGRDFDFQHSQFTYGNDDFSWITPAPEPGLAVPAFVLALALLRRARHRPAAGHGGAQHLAP
jgi:hypothetical protein